LKNKIEIAAKLYVEYGLGNFEELAKKFKGLEEPELRNIWSKVNNEISTSPIFLNPLVLQNYQLKQVKKRVLEFGYNNIKTENYLFSKIPINSNDCVEARFRQILARRIVESIKKEYDEYYYKELEKNRKLIALNIQRQQNKHLKVQRIFQIFKVASVLFLIVLLFKTGRIIDGFKSKEKLILEYIRDDYPSYNFNYVSIEKLSQTFYESEIFRHSGAICRDGWVSHSQGRGTCSHHGGVSYYFSEGSHKYSEVESKQMAKLKLKGYTQKAKEISWVD
jgi:hypothetical protein